MTDHQGPFFLKKGGLCWARCILVERSGVQTHRLNFGKSSIATKSYGIGLL